MQCLTTRDPSYWPPPEEVAENPHFKALWAQWEAAPPEWMDEEWRANLPPEYYRAFYGREQPAKNRSERELSVSRLLGANRRSAAGSAVQPVDAAG